MQDTQARPTPHDGAPRRGRIVLATLAVGSLASTAIAAFGPGTFEDGGLQWSFLLAGPLMASLLLLAGVYETAHQGSPSPPSYLLTLAGGLVLIYALGLAMPTLVYQRLSPAVTRLVELSRRPTAELTQRAMTVPDSRQRHQAALGLYLRTGRPAMFTDIAGNPAIFQPVGEEARRLVLPRWLAARPGALDGERRLMALADAILIIGTLIGLPLVIRRAAIPSRPPAGSG
jgi:hypothetical protein